MNKRKIAIILSCFFTLSVLIGAGTYAFFGDKAFSKNNTFQTGTLKLSTFRHDLPLTGPMFYSSDKGGLKGIGLWKPGDEHTRGMFVQNDGNLNAQLYSIKANIDADPDSTAYNDALEFAKQSIVFISILEPVSGKSFDSTTYAAMLQKLDDELHLRLKAAIEDYEKAADQSGWNSGSWREKLKGKEKLAELCAKVIKDVTNNTEGTILNTTIKIPMGKTEEIQGKVLKIAGVTLEDLLNGKKLKDIGYNPRLSVGEDMYFAYTVKFFDLAPEENNKVQGKDVYFSFLHDFRAVD